MPGHKVDIKNPLPRYYQVYVSLQERICAGEFDPGDTLPSERHLAVDYGVSRITLVKALDMLVYDGLVERQQGRGNFVLDPTDVDMRSEMRQVALYVPKSAESFIPACLYGATWVAMRNHIHLHVVEPGGFEEEAESIRSLCNQGFDGMILYSMSTHQNKALYRELLEQHYPFVMIDRYCPDVHPDVAVFDDELAGYELTKILIRRGYRRIAMLLGPETRETSVRDRLCGYRRALEEHGITYDERWVGPEMSDVLSICQDKLGRLKEDYTAFLDWMHNTGPTAVVAINDYVAERADSMLTQIQMALMQIVIDTGAQGVDCQLRISLATFAKQPPRLDLMTLSALACQSGETLGERAMRLLIKRMCVNTTAPFRIVRIPMEIREITVDSA